MNPPEKLLRREVTWLGGTEIVDFVVYHKSKSAYINLESEIKHLKGLQMTTDWFLYDDESGELLASKRPLDKKLEAKNLYKKLQSYTKVAKELGIHPTTARTWIIQED